MQRGQREIERSDDECIEECVFHARQRAEASAMEARLLLVISASPFRHHLSKPDTSESKTKLRHRVPIARPAGSFVLQFFA